MPSPDKSNHLRAVHANDEPVTVTLTRGQWIVLIACAAGYNSRVPLEQGDGGASLDTIAAALGGKVHYSGDRQARYGEFVPSDDPTTGEQR